MKIEHIVGNIKDIDATHLEIDEVQIDWYNTRKKIARLNSKNGEVLAMRLATIPQCGLSNGDILFLDNQKAIIISIIPTWVLCMNPANWEDMIRLCYEIGNLHMPLFFDKDRMEIQTPFEEPLQMILQKQHISFEKRHCVLDSKNAITLSSIIPSEPRVTQNNKLCVKVNKRLDFNFLLLQINDALFPIGNYTHSFGLESYVQLGRIQNKNDAKDYLKAYLSTQILYTDLLSIKLIKNAPLKEILELESTLMSAISAKQVLGAMCKLGVRFVKTIKAMKLEKRELFEVYISSSSSYVYPIVYGVFCEAYGLNYKEYVRHYLYAQASHIITNCVKLIPLAQSDGQWILASMHGKLEMLCEKLEKLDKEDLCNIAIHSEIKAMQHEQLSARLYIS